MLQKKADGFVKKQGPIVKLLSGQMKDIEPVHSQQTGCLSVNRTCIAAGKDSIDRRLATGASQMMVSKAYGCIHHCEIRASVTIQFYNRFIQPLVKCGFLPDAVST